MPVSGQRKIKPRPHFGTSRALGNLQRPPLERMLRIHKAIQEERQPTAAKLSRELEVSAKTVVRDLIFMRDRLQLPIKWNAVKCTYYYSERVNSFPTLQITEGEIVALVVAEKALQQYRGTTFEKPLLSAIRKLEQSLPDTISISLADIEQTISFRTRVEPILDLAILDRLAKATASRRQLQFDYRKPSQGQAERRVVDPYHLANINGEWFLFAFDHLRKDIRTFAPARIKSLQETGKTFSRQKKFSLEERLRNSFGVHSGAGKFAVVIRFDARVADYVREKKWHESQQLPELKGGEVELKLELSSLEEIQRWVLGWGGDARVVRPQELRAGVQEAAKQILAAGKA
jgi:proteasome accessory factor B